RHAPARRARREIARRSPRLRAHPGLELRRRDRGAAARLSRLGRSLHRAAAAAENHRGVSRDHAHGSLGGVVRALRLTSIASFLTIAFGVGTSKIIAVVAGPTGVALIGVYRTLVSIVTSVVQLGVTDRAIQK